jgi:prepilin-type N-terminal cleavage/methylation domain-containing protein/prepilin-type processing-associated H-X9-DG protein
MLYKRSGSAHLFKGGFTLVEILIVLGIVSLLAAILFPVARSVRESSRISSCASNLSQLGKAMAMYLNDHNERYPLIDTIDGCIWADAIYPYAKSVNVFSCPSIEHGEFVPGCGASIEIPGNSSPLGGNFNGSYDMVSPFVHAQASATGSAPEYLVEPKTLSAIRYRFPSSTILLLDGNDNTYLFHARYAVVNPGIDPIHTIDDLKDGGVLPIHRDGVNLLYVDGHVKWQPLESLTSTPMWRPDGREPSDVPTPIPAP